MDTFLRIGNRLVNLRHVISIHHEPSKGKYTVIVNEVETSGAYEVHEADLEFEKLGDNFAGSIQYRLLAFASGQTFNNILDEFRDNAGVDDDE